MWNVFKNLIVDVESPDNLFIVFTRSAQDSDDAALTDKLLIILDLLGYPFLVANRCPSLVIAAEKHNYALIKMYNQRYFKTSSVRSVLPYQGATAFAALFAFECLYRIAYQVDDNLLDLNHRDVDK